jgi:hypothetical protein
MGKMMEENKIGLNTENKKIEAIEENRKLRMELIKSKLNESKEKAKVHAKRFNKEFKNAVNTAIMAAFGFLIALVWKDVITEFVDKISNKSPVQGKLFSALIVTLICVVGIIISTKLFSEKTNENK